jgi:hypothetical protein
MLIPVFTPKGRTAHNFKKPQPGTEVHMQNTTKHAGPWEKDVPVALKNSVL